MSESPVTLDLPIEQMEASAACCKKYGFPEHDVDRLIQTLTDGGKQYRAWSHEYSAKGDLSNAWKYHKEAERNLKSVLRWHEIGRRNQ